MVLCQVLHAGAKVFVWCAPGVTPLNRSVGPFFYFFNNRFIPRYVVPPIFMGHKAAWNRNPKTTWVVGGGGSRPPQTNDQFSGVLWGRSTTSTIPGHPQPPYTKPLSPEFAWHTASIGGNWGNLLAQTDISDGSKSITNKYIFSIPGTQDIKN